MYGSTINLIWTLTQPHKISSCILKFHFNNEMTFCNFRKTNSRHINLAFHPLFALNWHTFQSHISTASECNGKDSNHDTAPFNHIMDIMWLDENSTLHHFNYNEHFELFCQSHVISNQILWHWIATPLIICHIKSFWYICNWMQAEATIEKASTRKTDRRF